MARTAPTVNGTPGFYRVTMRFIDARGDKRAASIDIDADAYLAADVNTLVTELGDATRSNLYEVQVTELYSAAPLASAAVDVVFASVDDNVVIFYKDAVGMRSQQAYIPAPVGPMIADGEVVNTANADYIAVRNAYSTLLDDYSPLTARFTERRDKNDAIPAT